MRLTPLLAFTLCALGCGPARTASRPETPARPIGLEELRAARAAEPFTREAWLHALDGFERLPPPPRTPIFPAGTYTSDQRNEVWWANLAGHDAALARLRAAYVGKRVYGYGGIALSCRPSWTKFYTAATAVRVRSIGRERGTVTWLATGSAATAPAWFDLSFLAYEPLRIVVDVPSHHLPSGENFAVRGEPGPCPEFELADFQFETTLSLAPPPFRISATPPPLRLGLTRTEILWTRGYPNEFGTKAELLREPIWHYGAAMGAYTVTFRHDRVASFHVPPLM